MKGYISIHRKIKNHWLWGDPVKFQWWLTMLMEVNYQEGKMNLGNELISISRGSSTNSLRTWADLFGCGTKAVSNFFKLLEKDNMITREILGKGKHSTTLINITNYSDYQAGEETLTTTLTTTQGQHKGNANGIQSNKGNKGNKGNKEKINTKDVFPFEDFWNKYPKKVAKKKCKDKYKKLKDDQKEKIKDTLDQFLTYKPFADYTHPNPETYLNQERWEDELGTPQTNSSNQVQQTRNFGKSNQVSYGARN
jgi:hypothetical protein